MQKSKALKKPMPEAPASTATSANKPVYFILAEVQELEFKLSPKPSDFEGKVYDERIQIGVKAMAQPNVEKNEFVLNLLILTEYKTEQSNDRIPLFEYLFSSTFLFKSPLSEIFKYLDDRETQFEFPDNLINTFVSTAYSTARGLLLTKLSHTYLDKFVLPMIPLKNLVDMALQERVAE